MEGHILSVFGKNKGTFKIPKMKFPVLSLLISGGHTELVLVKDLMKYKVIGETLDDAAGEAFDKVARMLGLPYPGGPEISQLAEKERQAHMNGAVLSFSNGDDAKQDILRKRAKLRSEKANSVTSSFFSLRTAKQLSSLEKTGSDFVFSLPRPMLYSKNFDFSFSGLKTAVLYLIRDLSKEHPNILQNDKMKARIAMEFENAVIETLIHKTNKAIEKYKIKTLIIAGGVSANKYLKKEVKKKIKKVEVLFPGRGLSTDNSLMIGIVGYLQYIKNGGKGKKMHNIKASGNLSL
jgi:N6-L-threonylcarbamoyladenine synthase